ncbi:MAG: putative HPr kinase/phosphorylase, regulates carbohydrate metabolism [Rhodospirillales bacterium]|nr:putative HPr kinase/phosphorylase, regulates carbohydrate metabolism [Rhodospirillales bacterium]
MLMVHATCIAFAGRGVLLRGPPGSGKSDLALRAIAEGARLIADDQVALARSGENVIASAPSALHGMIEIRGLGIMRVEAAAEAEIALVADLVDAASLERLPDRRHCEILDVELPWLALAPFQSSALVKLRFALLAAAEPGRLAI